MFKLTRVSRIKHLLDKKTLIYLINAFVFSKFKSPIYTAETFWRGSDESGTRTKNIVLITHLHIIFSTALNDVKL